MGLYKLLHYSEHKKLANVKSWILTCLREFLEGICATGGVEWYRFNKELSRRGIRDPDMKLCLGKFDNYIGKRGLRADNTAQDFLEDFREKNPGLKNSEVSRKPKCKYVARTMRVEDLAKLVNKARKEAIAVGLSPPTTDKTQDEETEEIWHTIRTPLGAKKKSKEMAELGTELRSLKGFIWVTNPDENPALVSGTPVPPKEVRRMLHKLGKLNDSPSGVPFDPVRYICINIPWGALDDLRLPAIWDGAELCWRPNRDAKRWGRAADFHDKSYGEGCQEAIHNSLAWQESFEIFRLGVLRAPLIDMKDDDWVDFLHCSLVLEAYKDYD